VDFIALGDMAAMDLALQTTTMLLNKELLKITIPELFLHKKFNSDRATNFCLTLILKCPNLREVSHHTNLKLCINDRAVFLNSLMSMKQLQVLELEKTTFDDANLCSIADHIPNLR
jgi:hypothetical protein